MKATTIPTDSIFSPTLKGSGIRQVHSHATSVNWKNPLFKNFFKYSQPSDELYKPHYVYETIEKMCAVLLLLIFSPIIISVAIGIKFSSRGPILYRQTRVGRNGELFDILKFRSMILNAEASTGHTLSWDGDPRITRFGNFLRKSHFDELPQLFNVLKGDMSFIGPRPERPEFTQGYDESIKNYSDRHRVKPGITGLAQIALVYDATASDKLKFDLMYIAFKQSVFINFLIAYYTAKKMFLLRNTAHLVE